MNKSYFESVLKEIAEHSPEDCTCDEDELFICNCHNVQIKARELLELLKKEE